MIKREFIIILIHIYIYANNRVSTYMKGEIGNSSVIFENVNNSSATDRIARKKSVKR